MIQRRKAIPLGLALSMLMGACDGALTEDPQSFLTTDTFYGTGADLDIATQAIYQSLRAYADFNVTETQASDQGRHDPGETGTGNILPDFVIWDASTPNGTTGRWNSSFTIIYRANLVLDNAPNVEMTETVRAGLVAEAKFLRGYAYLQLMKRFSAGNKPTDLGVPLLLTAADHAGKEIKRATQAEVFTQILKDLSEAEAALPATRSGAAVGRATRGAAQMALADTYLWRSSFMLTGEWQQASDWAKKVIDSNTFALNNSYFGVFSPSNKGNREMIFRVINSGDRANSSVVNTFYPRQLGFAGSPGGGFGLLKPSVWFYNSYAKGDIRGNTGPQSDTVAFRTTACFTNAAQGCPLLTQGIAPGEPAAPHVWKFRPGSTNNALGDVDFALYRYAETLLIYAEAQNELGNTATAIAAVNQVRARARRGTTGSETRAQPADVSPALGKLEAREAIYMERAWELAFEKGDRWFDLVRRDSMEPGYWKSQLLAHDPRTAGFREPLQESRKRFPIASTERDLMPTLEQNPGY
jgi:starch-binding outer membrane protein, SusD/RagB family